jgi:folate-binding protein YgfZ
VSRPVTPPATYGDVAGEYASLWRGAAVVEGLHDVVWVRGPDAVEFLDGLLSQSISSLEPGMAAPSLLLSPQGKLRATLWVLRDHQAVGLVADAGRGEIVAGDLGRFRIRVAVEITPGSEPVVAVIGPDGAALVAEAPAPATWVAGGEGVVVADLPFRLGGPPRIVVIGADLAEAPRAGRQAYDALRVEVGEPVMGVDLDDTTIAQEADLVDGAVDLAKGCYLGQELIARIDSRGHVNRRLRGVVVRTNVLPPTGARVVADEVSVGTLTSVAESLELRAPVGLAVVRREVEPGTAVTVEWDGGGAAPAVVASLPLHGGR